MVLLVAGRTDRSLVTKHRRLREFTTEDYDRLVDLIIRFGTVFVTPNTLTEASNLLAQHGDLDLWLAASRKLPNAALNFRHLTPR